MRGVGFHAEAVDPRIEAIAGRDWLARNAFGVLKSTLDVLCRRAVIEVDDLRRAIADVRPDVVIVDANCWGAMSMAEASDVGWLVFSPFTPYLRSRAAPPFGLEFVAPPLKLPALQTNVFWHRRFHQDAGNQWLRNLVAQRFAELEG